MVISATNLWKSDKNLLQMAKTISQLIASCLDPRGSSLGQNPPLQGQEICGIQKVAGQQLCVTCIVAQQAFPLQNLPQNRFTGIVQVHDINRATTLESDLLHQLQLELRRQGGRCKHTDINITVASRLTTRLRAKQNRQTQFRMARKDFGQLLFQSLRRDILTRKPGALTQPRLQQSRLAALNHASKYAASERQASSRMSSPCATSSTGTPANRVTAHC